MAELAEKEQRKRVEKRRKKMSTRVDMTLWLTWDSY